MHKQRVHKNTGATYRDFAMADDAQPRGRYGTIDQDRTVVGATAQPQYPAAAPHQYDPTGIEPPLGFGVDQMVPAREPFEVEQSLCGAADGPTVTSISAVVGDASSGDGSAPMGAHPPTSDAIPSPSLRSKRRRRR